MDHPTTPGNAAVILAAGAGTRFEGPVHKLRADLDGTPVLRRAVDAAVDSGIGPVIVVTGAEPLSDLLPPGVSVLEASDWANGRARSIAAAVRALEATTLGAMVVGLGDMPWVTAGAWRAVAGAASPIAVATYDGRRRLPVRIERRLWPELPSAGDEGARRLMERFADLVTEVPVDGSARDVDSVEDLGG